MKAMAETRPAYGAPLREQWPLDPEVTYLNHGGYGLTPHAVLAAQAEWRMRIERNPTRFMTQDYPEALRAAAAALAEHIGAAASDVVFVENATTGCNAVLRSLDFRPGEEILTTSLAYGAIAKAIRYVALRAGAVIVTADIKLPVTGPQDVIAAVTARLGKRTRLCVFDHVASSSALILPVAELTRLAHDAGARVLIDGAHAPGLVPLDVPASGAEWYVGNCHKWLMAPRACGFLWARPPAQSLIHPLSISHGLGAGFTAEFDWTGTRDPTPFLCVPAGIDFHRRLGGRLLMTRNSWLAREAARLLGDAWRAATSGPPAAYAAMASLRLPGTEGATSEQAAALQRRLSEEHRVEAAIFPQAGNLWLRVSSQAYNELADYDRLATVMPAVLQGLRG
ncbi:MAG TPA: aminotransferase class V-fold PLP-dependent enzyme [Stellaceae bacterium]|nr:aminotransferase class V-fold PLP-dependent enzyme [Stellaceae bacterium]